jgi:glyoxylase-like metal-dependent hydrolase (beta-lactamase superfamily II)
LRELAAGGEDDPDRFAALTAARLVAAAEHLPQPHRIELTWGIVLHPMPTRALPPATHTNAYLVGDGEMALVDPGSGDPADLDTLAALIDSLAKDGRRLTRILLTHAHPDHIGGVEAMRARYGVPVLGHEAIGGEVRLDATLADGDTVALAPGSDGRDWTLRVVHTPGHARGHLCFFHERTGALLSGDHVVGTGTVVIDPPEGDMTDYVASLEKLLALPVRSIFPAHGSPAGAAQRRLRALIAHRRERRTRVLEALAAEPRTLAELLPIAYPDVREELWRWAERSLLAHLLELEREGRAVRDGEGWRRG